MGRRFLLALATTVTFACNPKGPLAPSTPPQVSQSAPTPAPAPAPTISLAGLPDGGMFLKASNITPYDGLTRFPLGTPIKYYADPGLKDEDLDKGFKFWQELAPPGSLLSERVADPSKAQVKLGLEFPIAGLAEGDCANSKPDTIEDNLILSGFGKFALGSKPGCMDRSWDHVLIAHEWGHILGLWGHHFGDRENVMSSKIPTTLKTTPVLSASFQLLYSSSVQAGAKPAPTPAATADKKSAN